MVTYPFACASCCSEFWCISIGGNWYNDFDIIGSRTTFELRSSFYHNFDTRMSVFFYVTFNPNQGFNLCLKRKLIKGHLFYVLTCKRYDMSSNSPSGGINEIVRSLSNRDNRTHWWNLTSSNSTDFFFERPVDSNKILSFKPKYEINQKYSLVQSYLILVLAYQRDILSFWRRLRFQIVKHSRLLIQANQLIRLRQEKLHFFYILHLQISMRLHL